MTSSSWEPTLDVCHGWRSTLLAAAEHERQQVNGCSEHIAGVRKPSLNVHRCKALLSALHLARAMCKGMSGCASGAREVRGLVAANLSHERCGIDRRARRSWSPLQLVERLPKHRRGAVLVGVGDDDVRLVAVARPSARGYEHAA